MMKIQILLLSASLMTGCALRQVNLLDIIPDDIGRLSCHDLAVELIHNEVALKLSQLPRNERTMDKALDIASVVLSHYNFDKLGITLGIESLHLWSLVNQYSRAAKSIVLVGKLQILLLETERRCGR